MGIQPIDLQTIYTQIDKVGKAQVQQQLAAQTSKEAEMVTNRQNAAQKMQTVQETDAGEEKTGVVHEHNGSGKDAGSAGEETAGQRKESASGQDGSEESAPEVIRDPALGSRIDISG